MLTSIIKYLLLFFLIISSLRGQDTTYLKLNLVEKKLPFGLTEKIPSQYPEVAVVLSGGGSKGIAQLGILKSLEEKNIRFTHLIGTSMGSIIGGLYSSGYSISEIDSIFHATNWNDFFSLEITDRRELFIDQKITEDKAIFALRLDGLSPVIPNSINTGQKVSNFLNLLTMNAPLHVKKNFNELIYDFKAVSTDLVNGRSVVLSKGSLSRAMRASSSVSFLLPPVEIDSLTLVDGGLIANIPAAAAIEAGSKFIIAGNTTSDLRKKDELNLPWEIADQLVSIPMKIMNLAQIEKADIVIEPDIKNIANNDFSKMNELIKKGYSASQKVIDKIDRDIDSLFKSKIETDSVSYNAINPFDENNYLEKNIINKYSDSGSINSRDILYELYKEYFKGDYKNLSAEIINNKGNSFLKVNAEKNTVINKIEIYGVTLFDKDNLQKILNPLLGKPFNGREVMKKFIALLGVYRKSGYSLAEISENNFDETTGTLFLNILEGKISDIVVSGNDKTNPTVVTREFDMEEGEIYSYSKVESGLNNLRALNLFDNIDLSIIKDTMRTILKIDINEKPSALLRLGMRVDNEYFTQFSLDVRDENLYGTGTELGAIFSGGARNRSFILEHKANRTFDTYLTYKVRGFYESTDINTYQTDSTSNDNKFTRSKNGEYRQIKYGGSLALGTQVKKLGNVIVEGKFQQNEIKNINNEIAGSYKINLSSIKFGLSIDSQDKYPYPTNGVLINGYYETAQKVLGSDVAYTKFYADYTSYFSLNNMHTISTSFAVGFADETLPLSQQFSFGGQNNFFGYREYDFRGRQIFKASVEYRFNLPHKIFFDAYLKLRYDLGSIWTQTEQIRFKDLRHGVGTTISFDTPVGPADFSIGKSFLFKNSFKNSSISWGETYFYFTIGYYY